MAALHLIASSPDAGAAVQNCLRVAGPDDAILLIGNGVYYAVAQTFARVAKRVATTKWYALGTDVSRRGLKNDLGATVMVVEDGVFVELVTTHQPIVSWS